MSRLGQNFLISKNIARDMVSAAKISRKDVVLEIGPGKGILTEALLQTGASVVAVEKDTKLFESLGQKFAEETESGKLTLIQTDIRDVLKAGNHKTMSAGSWVKANKVVANIPYYLTGRLLRAILPQTLAQTRFRPDLIVFMLQKEVAQRIVAQTEFGPKRGKMNVLAVSVRVFAEPKIAFYVSKNNFRPKPKVDSAVVVFKKHEKNFFRRHKISRKAFFDIVKTGFSHKRKTLENNLKAKNRAETARFTQCGITQNARAEELTLENWVCLSKTPNSNLSTDQKK